MSFTNRVQATITHLTHLTLIQLSVMHHNYLNTPALCITYLSGPSLKTCQPWRRSNGLKQYAEVCGSRETVNSIFLLLFGMQFAHFNFVELRNPAEQASEMSMCVAFGTVILQTIHLYTFLSCSCCVSAPNNTAIRLYFLEINKSDNEWQ